jgi:electron transfer flavoprotein beta subunit
MKILVCLSVVPDTTTKITFTDNNSRFNKDGVQYIINPYDELALTRALELSEANGGSVTVVHVGTAESDAVIRKALAIGAGDAIRIDIEARDAMHAAAEISAVAKEQAYDLILTGRESIDYNGGMLGGILAEMLGYNFVNVLTSLEVSGDTLTAERDIDGGRETVEMKLPAVASAQKELCEPRIPNMRGIMMARSKPLNVLSSQVERKDVDHGSYELPPAKAGVQLIPAEEAEKLIDILHFEKKLI